MKILMISDVYFPRINGVSTSIAVFRQELSRLGHEVTLIAPDYPTARAEPLTHRIPSCYLFIDPEDRIMQMAPVRAMLDALREKQFDLLHIHTPFIAHHLGVELATKLELPVVATYHTYFEEYLGCYLPWIPRPFLRWAARHITRYQCNRLDAVVVPSRTIDEVLRGYGVSSAIEVIPTGILLDQFSKGNGIRFRAVYGIAPQRPVLLYVGRVAHEKNIDFLIHMAAKVRRSNPDILLIIAGEGPAASPLRLLVGRLDLAHNVMFVGNLRRDGELQDCYCAADLFVFASRTETQGLVLLEALALGVPVVSTAVMGTRDVLRDAGGAVISDDDPRAFAGHVIALLADPARRKDLALEARRYATQWSAASMSSRMAAFYEEVVGLRKDGMFLPHSSTR